MENQKRVKAGEHDAVKAGKSGAEAMESEAANTALGKAATMQAKASKAASGEAVKTAEGRASSAGTGCAETLPVDRKRLAERVTRRAQKGSYYFQHDYNARADPKIQEMLAELGMAGLGVYWCLVEQLYEQEGALPLRSLRSVAYSLHADLAMVERVVGGFGLFGSDGVVFWSDSVNRRMDRRMEVSERRRVAAETRWGRKARRRAELLEAEGRAAADEATDDGTEDKLSSPMPDGASAPFSDELSLPISDGACGRNSGELSSPNETGSSPVTTAMTTVTEEICTPRESESSPITSSNAAADAAAFHSLSEAAVGMAEEKSLEMRNIPQPVTDGVVAASEGGSCAPDGGFDAAPDPGREGRNAVDDAIASRIDAKKSKGKESKEKQSKENTPGKGVSNADAPARGRFVPPTVDELGAYVAARGLNVDPEAFRAYYSSNGWRVGVNRMRDWRMAAISWSRREDKLQKDMARRTGRAAGQDSSRRCNDEWA